MLRQFKSAAMQAHCGVSIQNQSLPASIRTVSLLEWAGKNLAAAWSWGVEHIPGQRHYPFRMTADWFLPSASCISARMRLRTGDFIPVCRPDFQEGPFILSYISRTEADVFFNGTMYRIGHSATSLKRTAMLICAPAA
jgi:hypothetical protein